MLQQVEIMHVAMEMLLTWIYINQSGIIVMEKGDVGVQQAGYGTVIQANLCITFR